MSFPPSAACKFLDLPPVNLRNLHLHLTKNPFASRPPHLCGVTLRKQLGREALCKQLFAEHAAHAPSVSSKLLPKTAHGEGVLSAGETDAHCNRKLSRRWESRGGCRSDLDIRQPHLGVLWLLSVATESNRIASAEAIEAAKKVKSAIEVTQDTFPIPSHIPSATDEKNLSRLHLPRKCPIMKRTRETCLFSPRSGKRQRSCFRFEEKIRFRQSDHAHWAAHAPGRAADFGFAADGLAGVL